MASDDYRWNFDYNRVARDSGFSFQTVRSKPALDQNIANIDIEQIIRDRDTAMIERYIGTVVEFTLDNDQTSVLDPKFVKIFRISQLAVQYLLFCKKYLDNTVVLVKQEFVKNNEEMKNLKRYTDGLNQELVNSKKQIKDLKSALNCQLSSTQNAPVFQCNECPKAFSTEEYLLAHIKRRHEIFKNIGTAGTSFQAETDKLQLEIKQLKERLNNTEKYIHSSDESDKPKNDFIVMPTFPVKDKAAENTLLADLQQKFELLKAHVENELRILQTQKFDQEKYEKWFETFLNKLEQSHSAEIRSAGSSGSSIKLNRLGTASGTCNNCQAKAEIDEQTQTEIKLISNESILKDKVHKHDSTTQTDFMVASEVICKNCQARPMHGTTEVQQQQANIEHRVSSVSNENIPQKLRLDTENRLEKFEEMLQERVTGSLEMLENQMQSLKNKMSEMEKQKSEKTESSPDKQSNISGDSVNIKPLNVVPKPRKKVQLVKQTFISSPREKPNQRIIKISPKPKEVMKTTTVILPKSSAMKVIASKEVGSYVNSDSDSDTESKTSQESESSESSESEVDSKHSDWITPNKKPSATSTLGQRSLTSLKEAAFTPEVLEGLQKEVENILNNRLEEIGVSPSWSSLPLRSYQRAMNIVTHQASLIQKNIAHYKHIRSQILKDVDKQVLEGKKNAAPHKGSKLKNILSSVRNKTKTIIHDVPKYSNKTIAQPKSQKHEIQKPESVRSPIDTKSNTKMYSTDSESDNNVKTRKSNAWSQSKLTDQTQKAYHDVIQELNTTVTTKMRHQDSISDLSSEVPVKEPNPPEIKIDESEDDNHSDIRVETQAKGVLKNYPSTGSLQKKKVLFDLESSDTSNQKQPETLAVPLKTNDGGSTTSIASSVLDGSRTNLNASEVTDKKQPEPKQELSDVSDWDLSEILN